VISAAPSPAVVRMRRSRARRRQGNVIVSFEVGPSATADLDYVPAEAEPSARAVVR